MPYILKKLRAIAKLFLVFGCLTPVPSIYGLCVPPFFNPRNTRNTQKKSVACRFSGAPQL
jgi:hypothetical protein